MPRARIALALLAAIVGCSERPSPPPTPTTAPASRPVDPAEAIQRYEPRKGDEIIVAGRLFHTGTPVVTWLDDGGYDAYRVPRRFGPSAASDPRERFGVRYLDATNRASTRAATQPDFVAQNYALPSTRPLAPGEIDRVAAGHWPLDLLREKVDQLVLHYDAAGTSLACFRALHDDRFLSVHFLLDLDGTIYQTLDLQERAWHATISNDRSIGIEIANVGSYPLDAKQTPFETWYRKDAAGRTVIDVPPRAGGLASQRTRPTELRPARDEPIVGEIQGVAQKMYDLTPQQYDALAHLAAALHDIFPRLALDAPRDADGRVANHALPADEWGKFEGVLGHYHVQLDKSDPGPAFDWPRFLEAARSIDATTRPAR